MAESRVEDLLETGVEQPVLPMSEIEAILRGEPVKPHSRIAELLLKYNPKDILIEKRITENGTYFASSDEADGYYKVVVDEYVPTLILKQVTANGTYDPSDDDADGYSSITVNVQPLLERVGINITENGMSSINPSQGYDGLEAVALNVNVQPPLEAKTIDDNGTYTPSSGKYGFSSVTVAVPKGNNADIHVRCLGVDGGTVTITATDGSTTYTHTKSITLIDETVIFDNLEYAGVWTVTNSKDATTETVNNAYTEGIITLMVSKIPQMTSTSTPYGECISSSNNWGDSRYVWYPFDGYDGPIDNSTSEAWSNQRGDGSPWIGYHFMDSQGNPIKVKMDKVWVQGFCVIWSNSTTRTLYFEGSNDGTNWEKIGLDKVFNFGINTRQSFEHDLNGGKYEYFRIRFDASLNVVDSRWIFIERIQVYANDFAPLPTGALTATENGTYDPEDYDLSAFDEVTVNVPNTLKGALERTVSVIDDSVLESIGANAFYAYTKSSGSSENLTDVKFRNVTSIGQYAFDSCKKLTTADFPNVTSIGPYAFSYCASLTKADFSKATSIGGNAFYQCSSLTNVDFPNATSVGLGAFQGCKSLDTLILRKSDGTTSLTNINAFNNTPFASGGTGGTLYVPQALISSYQSASNWSTILGYPNNQIKPIEGSIYE